MTVSSDIRKAGPYTGNGITTSFPFTFKVFAASDLLVLRTAPESTDDPLTLNSDYSVTLNADQNANPGGTISYPLSGVPLPTGWKLTAVGNLDYLQETDLTNGGGFYPEVIENALDRNLMLIQQVRDEAERSIRVSPTDEDVILDLPPSGARADKVLGFDALGNFQVYDTLTAQSVGIANRQVFTATAGQTDFVTSFTWTVGVNSVHVFLNGAKLVITTDYIELPGSTVRLAAPAADGAVLEITTFGIRADGTVVVTNAAAQAVAAAASASADADTAVDAKDTAVLAAQALDEIVQDMAGSITAFNNFDLGFIADTPASSVIDLGTL